MVASSLRGSPHVAPVPAQNTAVLEAIADGRTAQRVHPQPLKPDYDALAGDLFKRAGRRLLAPNCNGVLTTGIGLLMSSAVPP